MGRVNRRQITSPWETKGTTSSMMTLALERMLRVNRRQITSLWKLSGHKEAERNKKRRRITCPERQIPRTLGMGRSDQCERAVRPFLDSPARTQVRLCFSILAAELEEEKK